MRIAQICPRIPWPSFDGGRFAMVQLTRSLLRAGAEVDVLALHQKKFPVDVDAAASALSPARLDVTDIDTSDFLGAALRMRRLRAPLLVARFFSERFADLLRERLHDVRYDVIQLEGQFLLPYVPVDRKSVV